MEHSMTRTLLVRAGSRADGTITLGRAMLCKKRAWADRGAHSPFRRCGTPMHTRIERLERRPFQFDRAFNSELL